MNPLRISGFCAALFLWIPFSLKGSELPEEAAPVSPQSVVVVANQQSRASVELAEYYLEMRGIPSENLVLLDCPLEETISRETYLETLEDPLFEILKERGWLVPQGLDAIQTQEAEAPSWSSRMDFLVLCQGIPLRITHDPELPGSFAEGGKPFRTTQAAVDSELATLPDRNSQVAGFVRNPFFNIAHPSGPLVDQAVRVSRLDGPTPAAAKALVDHALEAEAKGLRGNAYVDVGGPHAHGDRWLEEAASVLREMGFLTLRKPTRARFQAEDRFDAPAFYFGWYSGSVEGPFQNPGFRFPPGAIGYHIHSASATTLRSKNQRWTGPLVERGITATVGNVYEPYLEFTHIPQMILRSLQAGRTWGEAASFSLPAISWQAITIGDPLYRPFQTNLERQLQEGPSLMDPLQQYSMIRLSRLLREEGRGTEALNLTKQWFNEQPGVPLALEILELMEATGEAGDKAFILQVLSGVRSYRIFEYGLALEVTNRLSAEGAEAQALELYTVLLSAPDLPNGLELRMLEAGRKLAQQLGETLTYVEWGDRIQWLKASKQ